MTKLLLIFGLFLGGVQTIEDPKFTDGDQNWDFFELTEPIKIKVIRHEVATVECGVVSSTAMTIGQTMEGDTIRVLDLCNTKNVFNANETVTVKPAKKPEFNSLLPQQLLEDKKITKTTYGTIVKK